VSPAETAAIRRGVAEKYRKVAVSAEGLFRYPTGGESALALGYPAALTATVPSMVRERFVGVGNPFALGPIGPGEAVLDLGCGAGFDAFIAATLVGTAGRVAGIDLSPEMVAVAEIERGETGVAHLEFREGGVEALPYPDASFDVALSNGVISLVPDKPAALQEIHRVLRGGGRLQICDMALTDDALIPEGAPWSD
jgi:SAM-dependent methyltransferase